MSSVGIGWIEIHPYNIESSLRLYRLREINCAKKYIQHEFRRNRMD